MLVVFPLIKVITIEYVYLRCPYLIYKTDAKLTKVHLTDDNRPSLINN